MSDNLRQALEQIELLAGLAPAFLDRLAALATLRTLRAGETVFCQGEPSPYFFGVLSGEITIQQVSRDPRFPSKILGVLGPGSLFGESSLFEESQRSAMASASQDSRLLVLQGAAMRDWMKREPEGGLRLTLAMLRNSMERLRQTSQELSVLYGIGRLLGAARPFDERLAGALAFLQGAVPGVDAVVLLQRSPYWEEYERLYPSGGGAAVPADLSLVQPLRPGAPPQPLRLPEEREGLRVLAPEAEEVAAAVLVPLADPEGGDRPLQGLLALTSRDPGAFARDVRLLLSAVAMPLAEALSRHRREEEARAQQRLEQSRGSVSL